MVTIPQATRTIDHGQLTGHAVGGAKVRTQAENLEDDPGLSRPAMAVE